MKEVPKDFEDALKANGLDEFFSGCTGPHRREYLQWIQGAKRPETRAGRIQQAVKLIAEKRAEEASRLKKKSR